MNDSTSVGPSRSERDEPSDQALQLVAQIQVALDAFSPFSDRAISERHELHLRDLVHAYAGERKSVAMPPERVIVELKTIRRNQRGFRSPDLTVEQSDALSAKIVTWCIQAYFHP